MDPMNEICGHCGFPYGSHHGGTSPWPRDYCPGSERGMDWENGPGTVFKSSRKERQLEHDVITLALRLYGEDENTFSPEAYDVMKRWKPEVEKMLKEGVG